MTKDFCGIPLCLQVNASIGPRLGHYHFFPLYFKFITNLSYQLTPYFLGTGSVVREIICSIHSLFDLFLSLLASFLPLFLLCSLVPSCYVRTHLKQFAPLLYISVQTILLKDIANLLTFFLPKLEKKLSPRLKYHV
jgi:hypothetical protein